MKDTGRLVFFFFFPVCDSGAQRLFLGEGSIVLGCGGEI